MGCREREVDKLGLGVCIGCSVSSNHLLSGQSITSSSFAILNVATWLLAGRAGRPWVQVLDKSMHRQGGTMAQGLHPGGPGFKRVQQAVSAGIRGKRSVRELLPVSVDGNKVSG